MKLPPLGQVIVMLYVPPHDEQNDYTNFRGIVLVPEAGSSGGYQTELLPPLKEREGLYEYTVKGIFAADADGDAAPELCILSALYTNGTGDEDEFATYVFKWSGGRFVHVDEEKIEGPLVGLRNASAVRAKLKKLLDQSHVTTKNPH